MCELSTFSGILSERCSTRFFEISLVCFVKLVAVTCHCIVRFAAGLFFLRLCILQNKVAAEFSIEYFLIQFSANYCAAIHPTKPNNCTE